MYGIFIVETHTVPTGENQSEEFKTFTLWRSALFHKYERAHKYAMLTLPEGTQVQIFEVSTWPEGPLLQTHQ